MTYILTLRSEAESDISSIFAYYEDIRVGLGHDFVLCVEAAMSKIKSNPLNYRVVLKPLRKVAVQRFPYRIFYFVQDYNVIVTAVFHIRKDPDELDTRVQ